MTPNDLYFIVETKQNFEFSYDSKKYRMFFDKDDNGKDIIRFGELYFEKKYNSYTDLMNNASIENHYFKDILEYIKR